MKHAAWKKHAAKTLREQGMPHRQIADELEVPRATIAFWLDPNASQKAKHRKNRYRGTCQTCGAPTTGCNGPDKAPTKCLPCTRKEQTKTRHWTADRITASIIQFHHETGRTPKAADFHGQRLDYMPPLSAVYGKRQPQWPTLNHAIAAAGLNTEPRGKYDRTTRPRTLARHNLAIERRNKIRTLATAGLTDQAIGNQLGIDRRYVGVLRREMHIPHGTHQRLSIIESIKMRIAA